MILPPSRSLFFPYTTLFRSHLAVQPANGLDVVVEDVGSFREHGPERLLLVAEEVRGQDFHGHEEQALRDRKSTCLNSSHMSISYAVFCLKKKKQKEQTHKVV